MKHWQLGLLLLFLPIVASTQVPWRSAQGNGFQVISNEFDDFVETTRVNGTIPGISIGVVHSGGKVELGSWGIRSEDEEAMTPETMFIIASCSKAFTASAIGILIDDFAHGRNTTALPPGLAKLDWSTKVADILPGEWQLTDEWASSKASLKDILSHVSGLPRHDLVYTTFGTPRSLIAKMKYLRPAFELRQKWSYNNLMYMLASHIVSKLAGMSFSEFIKTRIFVPTNMPSSTYSIHETAMHGRLTQVWTRSGRRIPIWTADDDNTGLHEGPGGIATNVIDMTSWLKVWINRGVHPDSNVTVLPMDTFETTTTASAIMKGQGSAPDSSISGYGMGWMRYSYSGHEVIYHTGGLPGFSIVTAFLPTDKFGIVICINADAKPQFMPILLKALDIVLGIPSKSNVEVSMNLASLMPDLQWLGPGSAPLAANLTPKPATFDIEKYAGTYMDPAYGSITLCSTLSTSPYCRSIISDILPFEDSNNTDVSQNLYATTDSPWGSHFRLRHLTGDSFAISITTLFPHGYGEDKSPFETWESDSGESEVTFLVEDGEVVGCGLVGTVGEMTERQRIGGTIRDVADVWFEKVG